MSDALKDELDYWRAVWEREIAEAHAKLAIHQSAIRQRGCECHTCRALGELAKARALLEDVEDDLEQTIVNMDQVNVIKGPSVLMAQANIDGTEEVARKALTRVRAFLRGDEAKP